MTTIPLKEAFYFKGSDIGCLLIHGFTSTPAELRELGERLHDKGYTVYGLRLAGHGTTLEEFEQTTYQDWIQSVEVGYHKLQTICKKIYVIGHSMGGVLALHLAEKHAICKIVLLAPAMINKDKKTRFVPVIKHFLKYTEWEATERPVEESQYLLGYAKIPLASVHELLKLQKETARQLHKIHVPILMIYAENDQSIDLKGIHLIEKKVSTTAIRHVSLTKCGHNLTVECEKETVFENVLTFVDGNC